MGADFPLLSNGIPLPNLVFFRSLLDEDQWNSRVTNFASWLLMLVRVWM
jgi:hypothetical protein